MNTCHYLGTKIALKYIAIQFCWALCTYRKKEYENNYLCDSEQKHRVPLRKEIFRNQKYLTVQYSNIFLYRAYVR